MDQDTVTGKTRLRTGTGTLTSIEVKPLLVAKIPTKQSTDGLFDNETGNSAGNMV